MSPDRLERALRRALAAEPVIDPGVRERARRGALATARAARQTGRRRSPHRRALAIGLGALLLAGGVAFGTATLWPASLSVDTDHPLFSAVVGGHRLMVAPTNDPAIACFVNRDPSGPVITTCDSRSRILSIGQGSITSNSRSRIAIAAGFAPGVTAVSLGSARVRTTEPGFYVVKGPKDATLTFYRGPDVVRAVDLGARPRVLRPGP